MVGPLAEHGFRLIAPSRFGYLGSSFPDQAAPEMQADAFAVLLDELGVDSVSVFGGSAGVPSAMQLAIRHPERCRALVLLVPATFSPDRKPNTSSFEGPVAGTLIKTLLRSDFLFWLAVTFAPDELTRTILATEPAVVGQAGPQERQRVKVLSRPERRSGRRPRSIARHRRAIQAEPSSPCP
jgi:2-hydroxy-6-oxonona-2,4-dienedioate hydrolase